MAVKVTLEFDSLASAGHFLLGAVPGEDPAVEPLPVADPVPKTRTRKVKETPMVATGAVASTAASVAAALPASTAVAGGAAPDDTYLKALTENVLAVAAEVDRDTALGILAKYKMSDGITAVKQCSALPKEAWIAVNTEALAILHNARAAKVAATAAPTSLI